MKKLLFWLGPVAVIVGLWFWFSHHAAPDAAEDEAKPTAQVQVTPLQMREISQTLPAFGVVESPAGGTQSETLGYDCVVKSVAVAVGSRVAAGDTLLVVAPTPDAQLQLDAARSAAALAEKSLAAMQQRFDLRLANSQDLLTAQQAAEDARLRSASYQGRLGGSDGRIKASSPGVVAKLDWTPGATVPAGTALVVLGATDRLEAHLSVEAADAARMQTGARVTLSSVNRPDAAPVDGAIRMVGSTVDPLTGAVDVRVPLAADGPWLTGEHVQAQIEIQRKTALVAPRSAVLPDDDKQVVYTVAANKAVRHEVQIGITTPDTDEVIAPDLKAGDAVVTLGNYELDDGTPVVVGSPDAKPDGTDAAKGGEGKDAPDQKPEAKP